ncbi:MAG: Ivy family c-type lysozyme inhibitor [Iodobacter sp.]
MKWIGSSVMLLALLLPAVVQARSVTGKEASACVEASRCAYFFEVYVAEKPLRKSLRHIFWEAKVAPPAWLGKGVSSPMTPVVLNKKTWLLGSVCEPHNCGNSVSVLYSPRSKRTVGHYQSEEGAEVQWLGKPDETEQRVLSEFATANSPLQQKLDSHPKLPVVLD